MYILETILRTVWVAGLQLSHKKCIEALIQALLSTLSVNLLRLSRAIFPDVKTLSTVRRIERLLSLKIFSVTCIGKAIVKALPPQKRYILTMDRTLGARQTDLQHPGCRNLLRRNITADILRSLRQTRFDQFHRTDRLHGASARYNSCRTYTVPCGRQGVWLHQFHEMAP